MTAALWLRLILFLVWWFFLRRMAMPENINPVEIINAAKAVNACAVKWGNVADAILSWHALAFIAVGIVVGLVLPLIWGKKS